jgi:hypothetical protein
MFVVAVGGIGGGIGGAEGIDDAQRRGGRGR